MQNYAEKYEISYFFIAIQGGGYTFLLIQSERRYQPEKIKKTSEISHNMNTSLLQMTKKR